MTLSREAGQEPIEQVLSSVMHETLEHRGRWVAVSRERLLAIGDSPGEVRDRAAEQGVEHPMIWQVPEWDDPTIHTWH